MSSLLGKMLTAFRVYYGLMPRKDPLVVPATLDFTTGTSFTLDLTLSQENDLIEFAQTIYVDNSLNSQAVSLQMGISNQIITVAAGWQGYYSVMAPNPPRLLCTSTGSTTVPVLLMNFPMPTDSWPATLTNLAVDGSGSITTGGTAQTLFGGTTPANGYAIYNPDPTNDLWVSDSTTAAPNAAGSIRVVANGGGYETPTFYRVIGPVSLYGTNTGQLFTAKRW